MALSEFEKAAEKRAEELENRKKNDAELLALLLAYRAVPHFASPMIALRIKEEALGQKKYDVDNPPLIKVRKEIADHLAREKALDARFLELKKKRQNHSNTQADDAQMADIERSLSANQPTQAQKDFLQALYELCERLAYGYAKKRNLLFFAQHFTDELIKRLEATAIQDGRYLADWEMSKGASIPTWIFRKLIWTVRDIFSSGLRDYALAISKPGENVDDIVIRLQSEIKHAQSHPELNAHKPNFNVNLKSMSDYDNTDNSNPDASPEPLPTALKTSSESKIHSILRVHELLPQLAALGEEMEGKIIEIESNKIMLTDNNKLTWFAYLGLTPDEYDNLDTSLQELANSKGWDLGKFKVRLAHCFAYLKNHPTYDQICDLMVPNRLKKRMDDCQNQAALEAIKTTSRDNFRSLIHEWIGMYGLPELPKAQAMA